MLGLTLVTPASESPLTLEEVKAHLIVEDTDDDALIQTYLDAATARIESACEQRFVTQTWDWVLDRFPSKSIMEIPYPPLQSVTSITYTDEQGVAQTLAAANYIVDTDSKPGRIGLEEGESWPGTKSVINVVTVRFVCGYGAASAVPEVAKSAIKLYVGQLYKYREPIIDGTIVAPIPDSIKALIWHLKSEVLRFA